MAKRFSVEAIFKAVDKITGPVSRMQQRVGRFTRSAVRGLRNVSRQAEKIRRGFRNLAMVATAAFAITGVAVADVVKTGMEFEQSIVNATVKVGGLDKTSARYLRTQKLLNDEARRLGATTEFTGRQAADGLNTLVTAGFNAEQAVSALPGILDLATIAGIDMAAAADVATGALGSFNLKADDAVQLGKNLQRVNDVLAKTTISSKNTMEDLSEALKDGGASAKVAGANIETFAAIAGRMADGNIRGTKAGTTMKNMFLKLAKPVGDAEKLLKKWDVKTMDAGGNMRDVVDILSELENRLDKLGTGQRAAAIETIFGKRAIAGVSVLLTKGIDDLRKYRGELGNVSGESTKMADIMRGTVRGSWLALLSSIESVKLSLFGANRGPLKETIDNLTKWVRANESIIVANIGKAIQGIVDHKDDIAAIAGFFVDMAGGILDGVKAMGEMKKLVQDIEKAIGSQAKVFATEKELKGSKGVLKDESMFWQVMAQVMGQFESPAKGTGFGTMSEKAAFFEMFRQKAQPDAPVGNITTPEERAAQIGRAQAQKFTGEIRVGLDDGLRGEATTPSKDMTLQVVPTGGLD